VGACVAELRPPRIVVACAGAFQKWGPTLDLDLGEWERILAVDLTGAMSTCRAAARAMESGASIVVVASLAGLVALPGAAAKSGLAGLVRALAAEWAPRGIRVNAVAPGFERRDDDPFAERPEELAEIEARTLAGRRGEPREVALPIVFLASPAASVITGATLSVDGGWTAV
jgi:NAD(P)-dependent dehydrogenase (short-subunit alcohol dehydrogenase family)